MNTKLTNIILIILLIFNVAFVGTWWMSRHKMHHPKKTIEQPATETTSLLHDRSKGEMFLAKTLGLDTAQQKKLDKILETHFNFYDKYNLTSIRLQNNIYNALKDGKDSSYANRCSDTLGVLKVGMEKELYTNFSSIKSICTPAQQKQFNDLIDNMEKEFAQHHDFHSTTKANKDSL